MEYESGKGREGKGREGKGREDNYYPPQWPLWKVAALSINY